MVCDRGTAKQTDTLYFPLSEKARRDAFRAVVTKIDDVGTP